MIKNRNPIFYVMMVLLVFLLLLMLAGVLAANYRQSKLLLRDYAEDVMLHLVNTVEDNAEGFLAPAEQATQLTRSLMDEGLLEASDDAVLERYFLKQLQTQKQLTGMFLGREDGSFVFVNRDNEGFRSKFIRNTAEREVELVFYDANQSEVSRSFDTEDTYDPRSRPWYQAAKVSESLIWTSPYLFFTAQRPGITAAMEAAAGVVGVDIEITGLSALLDDVPISNQGFAFIQDDKGVAVAYPNIAKLLALRADDSLPQVSDLGDPVTKALIAASPELSETPPITSVFKDFNVADSLHYALVKPFYIGDLTWSMVVQAPADDFSGIINDRFRRSLLELAGIGFLVCFLAVPLGFGLTRPFSRLHQRATTDPLTDLLNRDEFVRQAESLLANARRNNISVAVVMIDLDNFKPVNDKYGHAAGDEVLKIIAGRLQDAAREGDLVARVGGDEFTLMLFGIPAGMVTEAVERIRQTISQKAIRGAAHQHNIGATAGVVTAAQNMMVNDLLVKADNALIQGKANAKNHTYIAADAIQSYEQMLEQNLAQEASQDDDVSSFDPSHIN